METGTGAACNDKAWYLNPTKQEGARGGRNVGNNRVMSWAHFSRKNIDLLLCPTSGRSEILFRPNQVQRITPFSLSAGVTMPSNFDA
jgi:hypothetical protein